MVAAPPTLPVLPELANDPGSAHVAHSANRAIQAIAALRRKTNTNDIYAFVLRQMPAWFQCSGVAGFWQLAGRSSPRGGSG